MYFKNFLITLVFLGIVLNGCMPDSSSSSESISEPTLSTTDYTESVTSTTVAKGSVPMLVVLVSFNNIAIQNSEQVWRDKIFGKEAHQLNNYYLEVSGGKFEYEEAGVVSVKLDTNHPNIDVDDSSFMYKVYPDLADALRATDDQIDFSQYDKDGNGYITPDELIVTYIIAGFEDAYEGYHINYGIWAHQSCMSYDDNIVKADGVSLLGCEKKGNFALFGELHNVSSAHIATIGIIAHELGHATFDLPDLYNTYNPNSGGIGNFGLMAGGMWGVANSLEYPGATPVHPCAWSKLHNGWVEPIEYKNEFVTLYATSSSEYNVAKIPVDATHYYLLENRDNSGYDKGLYKLHGKFNGGIAIWKIDESKLTQEHITRNDVNVDTQNKGVDLVEAVEGLIDSRGDGGAENALYYAGNVDYFLNYVENISERGEAMSLNMKDY